MTTTTTSTTNATGTRFATAPRFATVVQFAAACDTADWFYAYSDDSRMWRRGKDEVDNLRAQADTTPQHRVVWNAWQAYIASTVSAKPLARPTLANLGLEGEPRTFVPTIAMAPSAPLLPSEQIGKRLLLGREHILLGTMLTESGSHYSVWLTKGGLTVTRVSDHSGIGLNRQESVNVTSVGLCEDGKMRWVKVDGAPGHTTRVVCEYVRHAQYMNLTGRG